VDSMPLERAAGAPAPLKTASTPRTKTKSE
jgi:hypothetical protein